METNDSLLGWCDLGMVIFDNVVYQQPVEQYHWIICNWYVTVVDIGTLILHVTDNNKINFLFGQKYDFPEKLPLCFPYLSNVMLGVAEMALSLRKIN